MSDEKYCPNCEAYRAFELHERTETYTIRGKELALSATVEACRTCGQTLFDEERDAALLEKAYAAYRQRHAAD